MQNSGLLDVFGGIDWTPDTDYSQHSVATVNLREVFERVMVPWSYLYEDDVLGLCAVNCNLASLLERNPDSICRVYLMNGGSPRDRSLRSGLIPQLFQGRSSAGSESYPGDRHFYAKDQPTLQIHVLNLEGDKASFRGVPAIAVHLHTMEDLLIHDE